MSDSALALITEDLDGLTQKQRMFVAHYIGEARGNATQAARLAGYSGDRNTLSQRGIELVRNSIIAAAIRDYAHAVISEHEIVSQLAEYIRRRDVAPIERNAWVNAAKLLLEYHGALVQKQQISVAVQQVRVTGLNPINPYTLDGTATETHTNTEQEEEGKQTT